MNHSTQTMTHHSGYTNISNPNKKPIIGLMDLISIIELKHYIVIPLIIIFSSILNAKSNSLEDTLNSVSANAIEASKLCKKLSDILSDSTLQICHEALDLSKKAKMDSLTVYNLSRIAYKLYTTEGFQSCYEYVSEAKVIAEESENPTLLIQAYYAYSSFLEKHVDIENAVNLLNEALEISYNINDQYSQSKIISGIGYLFLEAELYEDAALYFEKALKIAENRKLENVIATSNIYLGLAYRETGRHKESRSFYEEALEYYSKNDNQMATRTIIYGLAKLEAVQGDYKASNDILSGKSELAGFKMVNNKYTKEQVASNYYNLGENRKALNLYLEVEPKLNSVTDNKIYKRVIKGIADCYSNLGQFENASLYFKKYSSEIDLTLKDKIEKSIVTADLKYEVKTKEVENKLLKAERENLTLQNRSKTLTLAFLLLGSLVLIFAFDRLKKRNQFLKAISIEQSKINAKLNSRNKELSSFAGVVAHDIKAPIRTTSNFIQLIKRQINYDDKIIEYMNFIEQSNKKLSVFIDNLLEYTRSGEFVLNNIPIKIKNIIETVQNNLSVQIGEKGAKIIVDTLPEIKANETALIQIFQNIISNSIKFTKERTPIIKIGMESDSVYTSVLVQDNGIGIEEKYLSEIFNPLHRLHTAREYEGSGLGLTTCQKIMYKLGGQITVSSKVNEGSLFVLKFPNEIVVNGHN